MMPALPALVACLALASLASAQAVRDARVPVPSACDVRDHGATGARTQNATAPVQKAIDACHARGGGTVYVPPGEYTTGTLVLKDNVTLWLEAGAVFYLSQDKADFPARARLRVRRRRPQHRHPRARPLRRPGAVRVGPARGAGHGDPRGGAARGAGGGRHAPLAAARAAGDDLRLQALPRRPDRGRHPRRLHAVERAPVGLRRGRDPRGDDRVRPRAGRQLRRGRRRRLAQRAHLGLPHRDGRRRHRAQERPLALGRPRRVVPDRERGGHELRPVELLHRLHDRHRVVRGLPPHRLQQLGRPRLEQGLRHQHPGRGHGRGPARRQRHHGPPPPPLELVGQRRAASTSCSRRGPPSRGWARFATSWSRTSWPTSRGRRGSSATPSGRSRTSRSPASSCSWTPEATPDKRASHGLVVEGVDRLRIRDLELRWAEDAPEPRWQSAVVVRKARGRRAAGLRRERGPGTGTRRPS